MVPEAPKPSMVRNINDTKHHKLAYTPSTGNLYIAACVRITLFSEDVQNRLTKRKQDMRGSHEKHAYM